MHEKLLINPHVGDILQQEFLNELNLNSEKLAIAVCLSQSVVDSVISGKSLITGDIDLRLSRFFGVSEGYFLRLQNSYELMEAKRKLGETLSQITPLPTNIAG